MADKLRAKLQQNIVDKPLARAAETFTTNTDKEAKKNRTTVYIPDNLLRGLKFAATDQDTTVNDLILAAITEYITNHPDIQHWFNRTSNTG